MRTRHNDQWKQGKQLASNRSKLYRKWIMDSEMEQLANVAAYGLGTDWMTFGGSSGELFSSEYTSCWSDFNFIGWKVFLLTCLFTWFPSLYRYTGNPVFWPDPTILKKPVPDSARQGRSIHPCCCGAGDWSRALLCDVVDHLAVGMMDPVHLTCCLWHCLWPANPFPLPRHQGRADFSSFPRSYFGHCDWVPANGMWTKMMSTRALHTVMCPPITQGSVNMHTLSQQVWGEAQEPAFQQTPRWCPCFTDTQTHFKC